MPTYDYRCKDCGTAFTLFYKTYKDYDAAAKNCPHCGSADLSRLITRVTVAQPTRDYRKMSSGEMLSVLDSGNSREVGRMFEQVGGGAPELGADYHDTTQRLLNGEKAEKIERDLRASDSSKNAAS
ncbi:MAG: zinc ribbon domain-containing protein [Anaerolineae bacterium]